MNLLAIVAALGLEQWRAFEWRSAVERAFMTYVRGIEQRLNGGTFGQGVLATVLAIGPPVAVTGIAWWIANHVHPAFGLLVNVAVLYLLMGFRHFSHSVSTIVAALKGGDIVGARRALAEWRGGVTADITAQDVARLAIERGLSDAYRQVFGVLFWFMVLPGPIGAVLYRAAVLLADAWKGAAPGTDVSAPVRSLLVFGEPARRLLHWVDWVPVRLTALSFAIVGDFEDAVYCWRTQAAAWPVAQGGSTYGILLAAGAGALGVQLGGPVPALAGDVDPRPEIGIGDAVEADVLPSAVGLVWRALILWLLLVFLLSLANWAA
jgi:adenosylcobinamide-phosphate synthase